MVVETLVACAAVAVVAEIAEFLINLWGRSEAPPQLLEGPMSEDDLKMQEKTKTLIHEIFGEDIVSTVTAMDGPQRVQAAQDFTLRVIQEYGLDAEIVFYGDAREHCGFYNYWENKLYYNVADLLVYNEEVLTVCMHEFFDTVIHELRHAVQYRAVQQEGFWNVENETRLEWADNFRNPIGADVDLRGYITQTLEVDARTFAAGCLKGVFNE